MPFSLSHLRALVAVGEARSVSRAASILGVSQPAVSKSLRLLEQHAGVPLAVKAPRGMRLTEAGEALLVHARAIGAAVVAAEDDVAGFRTTSRGLLRIAASTTIARYILPGLIHEFLRRYPGVNVRVDTVHSRFIGQMLLDRQVDVALAESAVQHTRIRVVPWLDDEMVVVVGARHPFAKRSEVTPLMLASAVLLIREPGSGAHALVHGALRSCGALSSRQLVIDCHEAIKQSLMLGSGFAVLPRRVVAEQVGRGALRILPVKSLDLRRPLTRLSLIGRRTSAVGRAFDAMLDAPAESRPFRPRPVDRK